MFLNALELLDVINKEGYEAFIVGGAVRDYYLNIKSSDIDIATNMKPKKLKDIFSNAKICNKYFSAKIIYNNYKYDITSFRRDLYPFGKLCVIYQKKLKNDVLRRDFTINSLYMDKNKNIIDLLNAKKDLNNKIIRTIGNPKKRLKEDPIRILRAIRYAGKLNFKISSDLELEIENQKYSLNKISYFKKREELDKCFCDKNVLKILKLIKKYGLDDVLNIKYNNIIYTKDPLGIWAQIKYDERYIQEKELKEKIKIIKKVLKEEITDYTIYKYGIYINELCLEIKNKSMDVKTIYNNLPIHSKKDICITFNELKQILKEDEKKVNMIYNEIEREIVLGKIKNTKSSILNYIKKVKNNE